jgi:thiol-disulfide isomerase/thioredoxin
MSTNRPPVKQTGRTSTAKAGTKGAGNATLYTWIAVGVVLVVILALVIVKVSSGGGSGGGPTGFTATSPQIVSEVTGVPATVFDAVGVTSPVSSVLGPIALKNQPALTENGKPEVLYIGAEYCPYCAAERWATIVALSRFGTWSNLGNMSSYSGDVYPGTQSFTFVKAKYSSAYLSFVGVEEEANYLNAAKTGYAPLQKLTAAEDAEVAKYDTSTYDSQISSSQDGSIPFISFGNRYISIGASYTPALLKGLSRSTIAEGLASASDPITEAIIAEANYQTAAMCVLTKGQPGTVCNSSGVLTAAKALKIS